MQSGFRSYGSAVMWTRRAVFGGAAAAMALPVESWARQVKDTQPLWLVTRGASKVYIYGNAGSVTPKWSAPRVEAAFEQASVFWKETADQNPADRVLFGRAGVDPARPLAAWLTDAEKARVTMAAERAGTTFQALAPLKPWLAALSLSEGFGRTSTRPKVEDPIPVLTARARAQGKPIMSEFADTAAQLAMMNTMSDRAQVEFMLYTIENSLLPQDIVDARRAAWAAGDLRLETRQVEHFRKDFPNLYDVLEVERNRRWPARVEQMLRDGGTAFVMVGADHLVGPDSVLVHLGRGGLKAKRV